MEWFWIALLPPFFYGLNVIIDQYLTRSIFVHSPIALQVVSGFFCPPLALGILLYMPEVFAVPITDIGIIILAAWLYMIGIIPYLYALQADDSSVCAPIFQATPILIYIFGVLILGEHVTLEKMLYSLIVLTGAIAIAWDHDLRRLRWRTLGLLLLFMLVCAFFVILLRYVSADVHWLSVTFWSLVGFTSLALIEVILMPKVKGEIMTAIKQARWKILFWGFLQEFLDNAGTASMVAALAIAPSAYMVSVVNSFQPVFIMIVAGVLSFIVPGIYDRPNFGFKTAQKIFATALILTGLYLLYSSG